MRFLLGILMLWGGIAALIFLDRIPLPRGIFSGGLFTYLILRQAKEDASFQQWCNRWRRWWGRTKLEFKFGQQQAFSQRRGKEQYVIASEGLTEDWIRTWISEEMQKEIAQYGLDVNYRFLTEPAEIEERARKQAISFVKTGRIYIFVKLSWLPDWFQRNFVNGATKRLIEIMKNRYGEVLAHEIAEDAFGEPGDSCVFYPKNIKENWMNIDFDRTFSPETVTRKIACHEFRHCAQFQALRDKGGAELVKRVIERKTESAYGEDVLEHDAYQCQLGKERSIDEFVNEAIIEVR